MNVILASSSTYRKTLLERLISDFTCMSPNIDETPLVSEKAHETSLRLAKAKAAEIAKSQNNALIIASDQVACVNGQQLGKPGCAEKNIEQLEKCSGLTVNFYTSLVVHNTASHSVQSCVDQFDVTFRQLTREQIERYVRRERAFDCAGGFKVEGLGIALFEKLSGKDPNSLVGLPLIELVTMLEKEGCPIL